MAQALDLNINNNLVFSCREIINNLMNLIPYNNDTDSISFDMFLSDVSDTENDNQASVKIDDDYICGNYYMVNGY